MTNLAFERGKRRFSNINFYSAIDLDPHTLELRGLRLAAFGGELVGNASLEDFSRYRVDAQLRNFDIRGAVRSIGKVQFPYDGIISGPIEAAGDLNTPPISSLTADANVRFLPGGAASPCLAAFSLLTTAPPAASALRIHSSLCRIPA